MQKQIKFIYVVLMVVVVGAGATFGLLKYFNLNTLENPSIFKTSPDRILQKNITNCINDGDIINKIGDDNITGFKNIIGDIKCSFKSLSRGDAFRVEVKDGVNYIFTYKGKSINEKEFSELILDEYGASELSETLWEYEIENKPELKKEITLDINRGYFYLSDLTFDGYRDLLSSPWMSTKRSGSNLYILNSKNMTFEVVDGFDYFPADSVEFDANKKTIDLGYYVGAEDNAHTIIAVSSGIPEVIYNSYTNGYGEDINGVIYCVTRISKKVNGKMVSSTKKSLKPEDDFCSLSE